MPTPLPTLKTPPSARVVGGDKQIGAGDVLDEAEIARLPAILIDDRREDD